jgi:nucleoside-diphosphate-sugar epimerase
MKLSAPTVTRVDKQAFILGGAGQIGYAAAWALAETGWHVRVGSRRTNTAELWPGELGVEMVTVDRADTASLATALGDGCDLILDCVALTAAHGRQLLSFADRIGSAIVISSISVYVEAAFRDAEGGPGQWRSLPSSFTEEHPTMCASPDSNAGKKLALEQTLLSADSFPVTILRPGFVYGPYSKYPREWYFVKRALDGRPYRILSYRGRSQFHTTAAVNLAELVRLAAEQPGSRILNVGDPEPPSAQHIGEVISSLLGHRAENVLIDGAPPGPAIGDTPWSAPEPVILDMSRAAALGYRPKARYADAVEPAVRWMVDSVAGQDWQEAFPYFYLNQGEEAFDYRAEDDWLGRR